MKVKDISAKKSKQTMILIILVGILFIVEIFMALQAMRLTRKRPLLSATAQSQRA